MSITQERLKECLRYDAETGAFVWIVSPRWNVPAGSAAGCEMDTAIGIRLDGRIHKAHRLAWLYVHGTWPSGDVDHINGDWRDNRIANLRDVSHKVNQQNRRTAQKNNLCGLLGVSRHKNKWKAQIRGEGKKNLHLGVFSTPELAHAAYIEAKRQLHEGCTL